MGVQDSITGLICGLQGFMYVLAKGTHRNSGIDVGEHQISIVRHGVVKPQVKLIGSLHLLGI